MFRMHYCLGLEILGTCSDYYLDQYSVYNLGTAIAGLSIILAVSQLLTPIIKFRLSFRPKLVKFCIFLFVINILFTIIAATLPYIPGPALPLIGYHIFWELMAAVCIIISFLLITILTLFPIKNVTGTNIEKFYSNCIGMIASGGACYQTIAKEMEYFINKRL